MTDTLEVYVALIKMRVQMGAIEHLLSGYEMGCLVKVGFK